MSARPEVSRRTLLTGGAATAALAGVGVWAASGPTPSFAHGDRGPGNGRRVLIGYDSAYGSTGDVAVAIAEEFGAAGWRSEVRRVGEGIDLDRYQAAVLGAPVHRDAWKEECPVPGVMEALIHRKDESHGSTEEVPGGASGASDQDGGRAAA